MYLTYSIKLELLLDLKIKIEQVNLFELKLNSLVTLQRFVKLNIKLLFLQFVSC